MVQVTANQASCVERLHTLYDAYMKIISGTNVVAVQSSDFRKVDYGPGNIEELKIAYNNLWDQCGASSSLPRLGTARGGPMYIGC